MKNATTRREFLAIAGCAAGAATSRGFASEQSPQSLAGVIGLTTGSLQHQLDNGALNAMNLPRFMRDDLGMAMIDFNTRWLTSYEASYLAKVRDVAAEAGCYYSNLKVNHQFGKLDDPDPEKRIRARAVAHQLTDAAQALGARWIRFPITKDVLTPGNLECPALRELADYGAKCGVRLVVENNAWMQSDADAVVNIVTAIGKDLASPAPDTGNWKDDVRYDGLARSFPDAVTCDFKVFELDVAGKHARYDIRKCFEIGRHAGFRGPWAIEHWHDDLHEFAREVVLLRDQLATWIDESKT